MNELYNLGDDSVGIFVCDSIFGSDDLKVHEFVLAVENGATDRNVIISPTQFDTNMQRMFFPFGFDFFDERRLDQWQYLWGY